MSYQVLARKWRPRTFAELVGQEHAVRALTNALDEGRLHHAFLFTGTRGVGKTTIARILAKCVNCERGVGAVPCGECGACRAIDEGRFVDLIEVDAASRTKVDETRDLLENVPYAPTQGRYKVYLIDEVHMFSTHSFNALLKTLEEPPAHVKFLLATTDPQKVPVTILSRCLQFNLKGIAPDKIAGQLAAITAAEGIEGEEQAYGLLARAANGSLRDALSLLDQAIAFGNGRVATDDVREMLGSIDHGQVYDLVDALLRGDGEAAIAGFSALSEQVPDYAGLLGELAAILQRIALAQVVPGAIGEDEDRRDRLFDLAERVAPEDVQLAYEIVIRGRRDLPLAPDPLMGCEMTLLRILAFRPKAPVDLEPVMKPRERSGTVSDGAPSKAVRNEAAASPEPAVDVAPDTSMKGGADIRPERWAEVVAELPMSGISLEMASHMTLERVEEGTLFLTMSAGHAPLHSKSREQTLAKALGAYLGREVRLVVSHGQTVAETPAARRDRLARERQQMAARAIADDPGVRTIQETFGADILESSVRPVDATNPAGHRGRGEDAKASKP